MGQLADLHARIGDLLVLIQTAAGGPTALRIYDPPPVGLPELPCIYALTPDEDPNENIDTVQTRSRVTVVVRICVELTKPQVELLELADHVIETTDVWLRVTPPEPIDQAVRVSMRSVTPVFNEIATRGADFALRVDLTFRQTNPAP